MRELFFERPPLLLALFVIKAKTFFLRLKLRYLLLERGILVRRQLKALLENDRRAMLIDEALDFRKDGNAHVIPPVAEMKTPNK